MNINETKEDLLKIIKDSTLADEDKNLWNNLLLNADEEIIVAVHSFLIDYAGKLPEATEFLKNKISAIKNKDVSAWNSILKSEETFLNEN